MGRCGVPDGTSGILDAARIAKKTCRSAFDSVLLRSSANARALDLHALVEGLRHRRLHRVDALARRRIIFRERGHGAAREIEECLGIRETGCRGRAPSSSGNPASTARRAKSTRGRHHVRLDHLIEQRRVCEVARGDRRAADDHVQGALRADETRQSLGAAGARQNAELHLGQAHLRASREPRGSGSTWRVPGRRRARGRSRRRSPASGTPPPARKDR